jgi:hypothetical protein
VDPYWKSVFVTAYDVSRINEGKNLVNTFFVGTVVYIALQPEFINLPPRKLSVFNNLHFE